MIWWIRVLLAVVFSFGVFVGYGMGKAEYVHDSCVDTAGKYVDYTAWLSVRNGIYRCFWIENNYPHRVKLQGVIDVR